MYEEFFGLSRKPFQLTPDPEIFFASTGHQKALSYLQYGLTQSEGFIVITGNVGTGKTTIANHLISQLEEQNIVARQLVTPNLSPDDLIVAITKLFKLHPEGNTKAAHIAELTDYMRRLNALGRRMLLIIDEAQNLPVESIEELRMLSNIQVDGKSIIQSFLLGQSELEGILSAPIMEQFRQRVIASASLTALSEQELYNYINFRMNKAGWEGEPLFSQEAVSVVHKFTDGIPRKINTFLDRVLLFTFMEEKHSIDVDVINDVIKEVSSELNHQVDDVHTIRHSGVPATASNPMPKKQLSDRDFAPSESELADLNSALMGNGLNTEKIETLLESILMMNRRSLLVQSQILKELKIQNEMSSSDDKSKSDH
ncbi:AAA family ATPase [Psychrosphaera sp.]|nr:AAA family ATPase [Psychrosphaera sp.]